MSIAVAGGGVWYGLRVYHSRHTTLSFVSDGRVAEIELTFFPDRFTHATPSPPPALGKLLLSSADTSASVTLGSDLVPEHGLVRYRGPDIGAGFVYVRLGEAPPPVPLRGRSRVKGRVGEPIGYWCFGWRCAGYQPVADAEVIVMGGGEHGIDLASARTDRDGHFTIDGIDGELDGLGLRVRARGYGIFHQPLGRPARAPDVNLVLALAPTERKVGQLSTPAAVDVTSLRVLARGLPGVEAVPSADGAFVLDHVPSGMEPRLFVHGLDGRFAEATPTVATAAPIRIDIVAASIARGRVVDADTGEALADALVFCGDQEAVRADATGRYELAGLLPGDVELQAQWQVMDKRRRTTTYFGRQRITLVAQQQHDVDIRVTTR